MGQWIGRLRRQGFAAVPQRPAESSAMPTPQAELHSEQTPHAEVEPHAEQVPDEESEPLAEVEPHAQQVQDEGSEPLELHFYSRCKLLHVLYGYGTIKVSYSCGRYSMYQEWIRESTQQHTQSIVLRCARVASLPRVTTRCYVHTVVCEYDCLPSNE